MAASVREHGRPIELRFDGRRMLATIPYGETARDRAERFEARALEPAKVVALNLQHDGELELATTIDGTLELAQDDAGLTVAAELRGGVLDLVRRGRLTGVSPEFVARAERRDAGVRIIERAELVGVGLVDVGSYRTPVELRADQDKIEDPSAEAGSQLRHGFTGRLRRWVLTT